jgi:hypothetical protein
MKDVPALPGPLPTQHKALAARRRRFSWSAFETRQREEARRANARDRPGPTTGLPILQEFVIRQGFHMEGRGTNAWIIRDPPTLHRIVRRTGQFVFIEAAAWKPHRWRGRDRPLQTRRLSRARIDAGEADRWYRLASADAAPAVAALRVLGLMSPATVAEIRRAFRRAARHLHPDVGGSADAFRRLTAAYTEALAWVRVNPEGGRKG